VSDPLCEPERSDGELGIDANEGGGDAHPIQLRYRTALRPETFVKGET
jgi:hypothetical protein